MVIGILVLVVTFHLGIAFAAEPPTVSSGTPWNEVRSQGPVTLYNRRKDGEPMREFLVKGTVAVRPEELVAVMRDLTSYPLWMVGCDKAALVESDDSKAMTYRSRIYLYLSAPFPFSDRDLELVVENTRDEEKGTWEFSSRAVDEASARNKPQRGVVRVVKSSGVWRFSRADAGLGRPPDAQRTDVVYQWHSDPGGSIPSWLANRVTEKAPLEAMENLIARAVCLRAPPEANKRCAMQ